MSKEINLPTAHGSKCDFSLVDEKATVVTVCHRCGVLYSSRENNNITSAVAEITAKSHGDSFSIKHHVSVVSGKSSTVLEETLAVNEPARKKENRISVDGRR